MQKFKAIKYIRLSYTDDKSAESNSVSNQRKLIDDFLTQHPEIEVVCEKVDDGYSGVLYDRPAFLEMMELIKSGAANCVIVKDLSRLGREYIETGRYLRRVFPAYGVRFIAINDNVEEYAKITLLFLWDSCCYTLYAPYSRTIMQADLICFRDCQTMRCFAH